jgi:hypothetical protein
MSRTNDTSNVGYGAPKDPATLDDHGTLADSELEAVTGGRDSGAFRGRYQLRLEEANGLLSAQPQKD